MLKRTDSKKVLPRRKPTKKLLIVAFAFILMTSASMYFTSKEAVALELNGSNQNVKTNASTVEELLNELEVDYAEHDYISPSLDTEVSDDLEIVWKPAHKVTLTIDGVETEKWTTEATVAAFLEKENIAVKEQDKISPELTSEIQDDLAVTIGVSFPVTLTDYNNNQSLFTTSMTVAEFLTQNSVTLDADDRVVPALDTVLTADSTIAVTRVEKTVVTEETPLGFNSIEQKDDSLAKGTTKVQTAGQNGKVNVDYEVITENGVAISSTVINQVTTLAPVDKVVLVGTKAPEPVVSVASKASVSAKGAPSGGKRSFTVEATAYTLNDGGSGIHTATGFDLSKDVNVKVIAVDPRIIPLGTKVYVEGYGYATALDTGGAIKGNRIDIFLPTLAACNKWGRKNVTITVY